MNIEYTYKQTIKSFVDYINAYYDHYKYIFKETDEINLLDLISRMFLKYTSGAAKISCLWKLQEKIENEIRKGYNLQQSTNLAFKNQK